MKHLVWIVAVLTLVFPARGVAQAPSPTATPPAFSRELQLEIENYQLRAELTQTKSDLAQALAERLALDAKLASLSLAGERQQLTAKAVKELGGDPDHDDIDWSAKPPKLQRVVKK